MNPDPADDQAICKPYIESHMLALIDLVLFPTDDTSEKAPSFQIALTVCFCWGKLLFWSWVTWADQRIVSAEIVCFMVKYIQCETLTCVLIDFKTQQWLETIKCDAACSKHRKCILAFDYLSENMFASFAVLSVRLSSRFLDCLLIMLRILLLAL